MAVEHLRTDDDFEKVLVAKDDAGPPAWELRYDDPENTTILHRHGSTLVPTSFKDLGSGHWVAQCSECEDNLEVRGTPEDQ